MPGLLVCSWSRGGADRAGPLFECASAAFGRLQGLECTAEESGPGYRIARFAGTKSPQPSLIESVDRRIVIAVAGWSFRPGTPLAEWASVTADLAAAFDRDIDRALDRIQGQFAAAAARREDGKIEVSGDQLGAYPLYTAEREGIAWASTSAMALACALRPPLDLLALRALFMEDAIRSPHSAFEGIRRTRFGERHRLKDGRIETRRVWSPFPAAPARCTFDDAVAGAIGLLEESGERMVESWPRWVSDLTSGLDSRLLAAVLTGRGETLHATVNGSARDLDVVVARRIAEKFRWPLLHNEPPADWGRKRWPFFQRGVALADGEKSGSALDGTVWAKDILRGSYDAATGGHGGELLRDFLWQQDYPRIGRTTEVNARRLVRLMFTFGSKPDMNLFRRDWRPGYEDDLVRSIEEIIGMAPDALNHVKLDAVYLWRLSGHYGRYGGSTFPVIASPMPLVTGDIYSHAAGLPCGYRIRGRLVRHVITRSHPRLAAMPTWHGGTAEPLTILRPVPYAKYYYNLGAKVFRKAGRMVFKSAAFAPPTARRTLPSFHTDFVSVLDREGMLAAENLITRRLYDEAYLEEFLARAKTDGFGSFAQLYAIVSIELVCRLCGIDPGDRSF